MKHRDLTPEERALWLETTRKDKRLKEEKKKKAAAASSASAPKKIAVLPAATQKKAPPTALKIGDTNGLDKRRTNTAPQATLDLHGLTQEKAHAQVVAFIKRAVAQEYRVVRIITGKGSRAGGVLKANLPKWLEVPQLRPFILAISYATPKEGGEGVLQVQLKRKR